MTSVSHLTALERRHELLEQQIANEMQHPSQDVLKIQELKRKKLEIKDQIAKLMRQTRH